MSGAEQAGAALPPRRAYRPHAVWRARPGSNLVAFPSLAGPAPEIGVEAGRVVTSRPTGLPDQIREALAPRSRLAMAVAAVFGGGVPYAAHRIAHAEAGLNGVWGADWSSSRSWVYAAILLGCLLYSAPKVYRWAMAALGKWYEALGFVVLTEGIMTLYREQGLAVGALVVLVAVNALATGVRVARGGD